MFRRFLLIAALTAASLGACDKVDHDNIDKWTHTEKGPEKLKKAFTDESVDPDLAAHAAANMVKTQKDGDVRTGFDAMTKEHRAQVVSKLAPRLWDMARVDREDLLPASQQIQAKDMLVHIRKFAEPADTKVIDGYLADWYGVKSYEERAKAGAHLGAEVMRTIGTPGGKKLIEVLNSLIAAPGQEKTKFRIGDQLLRGLAASGDPAAIKKVIETAKLDRGDQTLSRRAMEALKEAFVKTAGYYEIREPAVLKDPAILDGLASIAKDDAMPPEATNDAVDLLGVVGAPACIAPLVQLIAYPNGDPAVKYQGAERALRCGQVAAIKDVVEAFPSTRPYDQKDLQGAVAGEIARLTPKDKVLAAVRDLLGSKNKVARWVALETLLALKSTEDIPKIKALEGDRDVLTGFWGEPGKPDPTVGDRAKQVVEALGGK